MNYMVMKCKNCGAKSALSRSDIIEKGAGNPSYFFKCPTCGSWNNIKCRHRTGKTKSVKISSQIFQ